MAVPLWSALVLLTALPPLAQAYQSPLALAVLAGCVALPFGIVALGAACRVPRWAVATVSIILGVTVALVFAGQVDASAGPLPSWRASPAFDALGPLIDSIPRLLTAPRPAPPDPGLLVPVALLVWIVATALALGAVGARRAGVGPLLGAVVLQVAGALLTAGRGDALGLSALATGLLVLLGWVLLPAGRGTAGGGRAPKSPSRARAASRGALLPGLVVVVIATFALTASAVGSAGAFEPRALVAPPRLPAAAGNPVPEMAVWSQRGDDVAFTITALDGPLPERVALATLPDFDGAAWRVDAQLRAVGVVGEPDTPPAVATRTATYELTPGEMAGVWVPSAGVAEEVAGQSLLQDLDTGTLVAPVGWTEPVTITTTIPAPSAASIGRASVPAAGYERYLALPRAPEWFSQAATIAAGDVSSRWEQVTRLADAVRYDTLRAEADGTERALNHAARSGSSYARLTQFLTASAPDGGQVGTTEQFAASFAVLARTQGIPSRVVAGFEVPGAGEASSVEVTGANARVWAEVYLSRVGWVAVDPGPDSSVNTELPPPQSEDGSAEDPDPEPEEEDSRPTTSADPEATPDASGLAGWAYLGGVAALAIAAAAGLAFARALRRARWRRAGARGAWAQVEDSLRLAGRPVPDWASAPDIAAALPGTVAAQALAVAERAEASAFGPGAAGDDDADADADADAWADAWVDAWADAQAVDRGLRGQAGHGRRALWHVSPRVWRR